MVEMALYVELLVDIFYLQFKMNTVLESTWSGTLTIGQFILARDILFILNLFNINKEYFVV